MDFSKALEAMKEGKQVRRKLYCNEVLSKCVFLDMVECNFTQYKFSYCDVTANDWEIVEDIPEVKPQCRYYVLCPTCGKEYRIRSDAEDFICGRCSKNWKIDKTNTSLNTDNEPLTIYKEWLQKMIKDYDTQIQVYLKDKKYERAGSFDRSRETFKTCLCMLERLEGD